jgi:hypothetical protein
MDRPLGAAVCSGPGAPPFPTVARAPCGSATGPAHAIATAGAAISAWFARCQVSPTKLSVCEPWPRKTGPGFFLLDSLADGTAFRCRGLPRLGSQLAVEPEDVVHPASLEAGGCRGPSPKEGVRMKLHANAALSFRQRERIVRRVVDEGWSVREAAAVAEVSARTAFRIVQMVGHVV